VTGGRNGLRRDLVARRTVRWHDVVTPANLTGAMSVHNQPIRGDALAASITSHQLKNTVFTKRGSRSLDCDYCIAMHWATLDRRCAT
jgi:hypothetical protein